MTHPERIVPDETEPGVVVLHAVRYEFALAYCEGADVLDAACGVGYGSAILARSARRVLGVDASADAIDYARRRYGRSNVEFAAMDVQALDLPDASFDVVCSFETLEHVDDVDAALAEAARVLRDGGTFIASTPHVEATTYSPENPHHRVELSVADFRVILEHHFARVEIYGQRRRQTGRHRFATRLDVLGLRRRLPSLRRLARPLLGTPATEHLTAADVVIERDALERATEIVAVCLRR